MSNETPSDKKPDKPKGREGMTRYPVKHLFFADNLDVFPGFSAQISNLKTHREKEEPNYFTCDYIPAMQAFEITWHRTSVPDVTRVMTVYHVRTWEWL